MIRADINENFLIVASVVDETVGQLVSGEIVSYDIRDLNDLALTPAISGTLDESAVEPGVYKKNIAIPLAGSYVCYTTCSGYITSTEDIIINEKSIEEFIKDILHFNISSEDVIRSNVTPTASQVARNVPFGRTDYILTKIKNFDESDWSTTTVSGVVYAHYRSNIDSLPFKIGGAF